MNTPLRLALAACLALGALYWAVNHRETIAFSWRGLVEAPDEAGYVHDAASRSIGILPGTLSVGTLGTYLVVPYGSLGIVAAAMAAGAFWWAWRRHNHPLQWTGAAPRGFEVANVPERGPGH